MSEPYLYRDVVMKGKILKATVTDYLFCDDHNHYILSPERFALYTGCFCGANAGLATTRDYAKAARPRFEVYNKDPEFMWDHESDTMFWVKKSGGGKADPGDFVGYMLKLLNQVETQKLLAIAAQRHGGVPHKLSEE